MSTEAFARVKYFFNRCRPDLPVPADDGEHFYVDFDAQGLRGERCVETLASTIALAEGPTCQLFTGFAGSGKSSELLRLRARLSRDGYFVVYLDAADVFELQKPIDYPDILIHMGLAVQSAIDEARAAGKASRWVRDFGQEIKELLWADIKVSAPTASIAGAKIGVELRYNDQFRGAVRAAAGTQRLQFISQAARFFEDARDVVVSELGHAGLVVIFDSLEKIGDLDELQQRARQVFVGEHAALRLPAIDVIYTVPARLVFSSAGPELGKLYSGEPQVLPMVKMSDRRSGGVLDEGRQAMRSVLVRRLDLDEVFGGDESLVGSLVDHCGGYIRDLLRLTQYSIQHGGALPIGRDDVDRAIAKLRRSYVRAFRTEYSELLAHVRQHRPEVVPKQLREHLEDVIASRLTMVYGNDVDWYDVHPLVRDLVQA